MLIRWRGRWEGGSGWGIHVNPWLIHVNVWQKSLQYCKVISLQLIKINGKKKSSSDFFLLVAQSCPTPCNPMDSSPPGPSVCGILLARILEWGAISFSRESSWPRDRTQVSCITGRFFTIWATLYLNYLQPVHLLIAWTQDNHNYTHLLMFSWTLSKFLNFFES